MLRGSVPSSKSNKFAIKFSSKSIDSRRSLQEESEKEENDEENSESESNEEEEEDNDSSWSPRNCEREKETMFWIGLLLGISTVAIVITVLYCVGYKPILKDPHWWDPIDHALADPEHKDRIRKSVHKQFTKRLTIAESGGLHDKYHSENTFHKLNRSNSNVHSEETRSQWTYSRSLSMPNI